MKLHTINGFQSTESAVQFSRQIEFRQQGAMLFDAPAPAVTAQQQAPKL
jgi:hypothetical protein